jgi:23S rRNA (cytidine1920-2'-O)/16S rRNA (cytidine1409-2'-O)-methyltransferase
MDNNNRSFVASMAPQRDGQRQFVSRGGLKLQHAIENFKLKIENLTVLDVGASTGGFVDCLLQNDASKIYALDTAYGELAWKLRNDPRVVVMERTNILHLTNLPKISHPEQSEGSLANASQNKSGDSSASPQNDDTKVDIVTIDAGWTKLGLILPVVRNFLKPQGQIIALLKPHYEADKRDLIKGILPEEKAEGIKEKVSQDIQNSGFQILHSTNSPILGGGGNTEYLLLLKVT